MQSMLVLKTTKIEDKMICSVQSDESMYHLLKKLLCPKSCYKILNHFIQWMITTPNWEIVLPTILDVEKNWDQEGEFWKFFTKNLILKKCHDY